MIKICYFKVPILDISQGVSNLLSLWMLVCPQGRSFPECRDVFADFALTLSNGQEAEAVVAALQESLSRSISDGSLQKFLDEVSVEAQVTILGLSGDEPKDPAEPTEVKASVSFHIGLSQTGLQKEDFLTDITAAVSQLSLDVLANTQLVRRDLILTAATGGKSTIFHSSDY